MLQVLHNVHTLLLTSQRMQTYEQDFIDACKELSQVAERVQAQMDKLLARKQKELTEQLRYMETYDKQQSNKTH